MKKFAPKAKSDAFDSICSVPTATHRHGAIDTKTMCEFDEACLTVEPKPASAQAVRKQAGKRKHAYSILPIGALLGCGLRVLTRDTYGI